MTAKRFFILPALLLAMFSTSLSQDMVLSSEIFSVYAPDRPGSTREIYREPRWVSWPGSAISFNLLGVAQAGPVIQMDIHLNRGLYLVPTLRYNYLGYASHHLMTSYDSDSMKYQPASFAAGLGIRHFFALQQKNRLVFVGLFGEYSTDKASYNLDEPAWESERVRQAVNVVANIGYRWWFKKDFFLQLGVYGGISFEITDESRYLHGAYKGDLEKDFRNSPFVGLIDFSFGWNL